jgi:hypothetical protein
MVYGYSPAYGRRIGSPEKKCLPTQAPLTLVVRVVLVPSLARVCLSGHSSRESHCLCTSSNRTHIASRRSSAESLLPLSRNKHVIPLSFWEQANKVKAWRSTRTTRRACTMGRRLKNGTRTSARPSPRSVTTRRNARTMTAWVRIPHPRSVSLFHLPDMPTPTSRRV